MIYIVPKSQRESGRIDMGQDRQTESSGLQKASE